LLRFVENSLHPLQYPRSSFIHAISFGFKWWGGAEILKERPDRSMDYFRIALEKDVDGLYDLSLKSSSCYFWFRTEKT
jgi:hypothetical protein